MRYLSVCSGIEAASCAWHPLGWEPVAFSEIEKFPSAVLAHHYPTVPNWGDMTKFKEWPDACACVQVGAERSSGRGVRHGGSRPNNASAKQRVNGGASGGDIYGGSTCAECGGTTIDLLVGGTPCQSFSVAGLRKGLADPRGNLALTYLALADKYRPEWLVWENVPGVLSSGGGRDFGSFLGGLGELGYGWAYRVLDAQYFGLAQRRKRVFVVASLGGWQRAAAVLFDAASLRGDSAPRREAGQRSSASLRTRAPGSGGQGTDWEHTVAGTLGASMGRAFSTDFQAAGGLQPVAHTLMARAGSALTAPDYQTFVPTMLSPVAPCLDASMDKKWGSNQWVDSGQFVMCASDVAHSLRAEGFDASEDGTGRGTPLVAIPQVSGPILSHRRGVPSSDEVAQGHLVAQTLTSGGTGARGYIDPVNTTLVAFSVKDHGADAGEIAPTLRSGGHDKSHANGGVMPAIAFAQNSRDEVRLQGGDGQIVGALAAEPGMKQTTYISFRVNDHGADATEDQSPTLRRQGVQGVQAGMAVRRLTPQECERLQGFPDEYTLTTYRGKPAADGPRYKALGNSMAVPVMHWIGKRIAQVQAIP